MRKVIIVGALALGALIGASFLPPVADADQAPSNRPTRQVQTRGNVRVTLLGVNRGVTYRQVLHWPGGNGHDVLDKFGATAVPYLTTLFLVEKLGETSGDNGAIDILGPNGKLDFSSGEWGPFDPAAFRSGFSGHMEFLPELREDAVETFVYKQVNMRGPDRYPDVVTVRARFFGEDFEFESIQLP